MKPIIVPLDGSELAEQALHLATAIAPKLDADIVLTTAITAGDRWSDDGAVHEWEADEQAAVERYLRTIAEKLLAKGLRARTHVVFGHPHSVIVGVAGEEAAGLIVMTTHGRSGVSRLTIGSVADKVLRTSDTPLILIHSTRTAPVALKRIVVALDGSPLAEVALPEAERLASSMGASLVLVQAVVPTALVYGGEGLSGALPVLSDLEADARDYLEGLAAPIRDRGLEVTVTAAVGIPAQFVLDTARGYGAGLIAMTTHGRSGLDRWMFGSVADTIVRRGDIPLLVVRPPVQTEQERERIPVVGAAVVPPPAMTESQVPLTTPRTRREETRPHRPERSPGR